MQLAAQIYEFLVKNFKQEDFSKFEFPRIVKEDWPNIFKIKYQMADLQRIRRCLFGRAQPFRFGT